MATPSKRPAKAAAPQAPKKPRRWRRRILWGLGIIVLLIALAPLALSFRAVRNLIASGMGEALGVRVEIKSSSGYWFRGIELDGITVHSPEGFDGPLAVVKRIHADVDVIGVLTGRVEASVRVIEPHVTLRRNKRGKRNVEPVLEHLEEDEPAAESSGRAALEIVVIGGRVEHIAAHGATPEALRDIQITLGTTMDGATRVSLLAHVVDGLEDGGDARVRARAELDADGAGPYEIETASLALPRLARLVEDTTGLRDLAGTANVEGRGNLRADGTVDGTLTVKVEGLAAVTAAGVSVRAKRVVAGARMQSKQGATQTDLNVRMGDVRVERRVGSRTDSYREPSITMTADMRYWPEENRLRVSKAGLDAGWTASAQTLEPLRIELGEAPRFEGKVKAKAHLARLGQLGGLVPVLESLVGGTLEADLHGSGAEGLDVWAGVAIANLRLRAGELAPRGYSEKSVIISARANRNDETGTSIRIYKLESGLATARIPDARKGFSITVDADERFGAEGDFRLDIDLPRLSQLMADDLGLERGERIEGRVALEGTGRGAGRDLQFDTTLSARDVLFPPSWAEVGTRANFNAKLKVTRDDGAARIVLGGLSGMGLRGSGQVLLDESKEGTSVAMADLRIGADLAAARPWLGALLGLERGARLSGRSNTTLRMLREGDGRRLTSTTQIDGLVVQVRSAAAPIFEPRATLRADVRLAPEGGRHRADELHLTSQAIEIDVSGATYVAEPDADIQARLRLGGTAERLAPVLSALLGKGYEDLRGAGPLRGTVTLSGATGSNGSRLVVDGSLAMASWTTAGLAAGNVRLSAQRADLRSPYAIGLECGLNGGTASVKLFATPNKKSVPWNATANLRGVDTSRLLTSKGVGRYLAFALPALLPAKANTAVLSGRLAADLEGRAPDLSNPAMENGLAGHGTISMAQGEIRRSTLFGGGSGSGLAKVIAGLRVAVPEAGVVLTEVSQAVTFHTLESKFRVGNRMVLIERTALSGKRVVIGMNGTVGFDERISLNASTRLLGKAGQRLGKVLPGGVIPMKVRGTLERPDVQPQVDLKRFVGNPLDRAKDLIDRLKKKRPKIPKIPNPFK